MSEWSKVRLSKSRVPNGTVGSNPTLSARTLSLQAVFTVCRLFLFPYLGYVVGVSLLKRYAAEAMK